MQSAQPVQSAQPAQPIQPTAAAGADEARPRVPIAGPGPLSMDELKNKLKKRVDDGSAPSNAPGNTGSRLFTRPPPGVDSGSEQSAPSGSRLFRPPAEGGAEPAATGPVSSRLFNRPPAGAEQPREISTSGSRLFNRPAADSSESAPGPVSARLLAARATASSGDGASADATPAATPVPSVTASRLKFGNKGSQLGIGAIAAGAIASNAERKEPPAPAATEPVQPSLPPPVDVEQLPPTLGSVVRAIYDYEAVDEGEIGFSEGSEIEVHIIVIFFLLFFLPTNLHFFYRS